MNIVTFLKNRLNLKFFILLIYISPAYALADYAYEYGLEDHSYYEEKHYDSEDEYLDYDKSDDDYDYDDAKETSYEDKDHHKDNWSDYIAEDTIANFKAETGIDVTYDVYDSNEILEAKMSAGSSGYDLVVPTADFLARGRQAGVYAKMDFSRIPNAKNQSAQVQALANKQMQDDKSGLVYMWGTTGIGYNIGKVEDALGKDAPLDSWSLVFDPANMEKLADCGVHFLDAPTEMIPAALKYIGEDPNSHDPEVIAKAEAVYSAVRPYIRKFHSSEYINALATGEICIAVGWSGDVFQAQYSAAAAATGNDIDYSIHNAGTTRWFD